MAKANSVKTLYRRDGGWVKWLILIEDGCVAQGRARNKSAALKEAVAEKKKLIAEHKLKGYRQ